MHPLRGIGLLTLLLGLGSLVFALAYTLTERGQVFAWFAPVGVIVCSIAALRNRSIRRGARALVWAGLVSTVVAGLVVGATYVRAIQSPAVQAVGTSIQPLPIQPTIASAEVERLQLAATAGTLAYLLRQSHSNFGNWPAQLAEAPDGRIVTPAGAIVLPVGSSIVYTPGDTVVSFALTGASGMIATWNSSTDRVTTQ
jgi:hypothetical protein